MSQQDRRPPYALFVVPPPGQHRRPRLALLIVSVGVLTAAAIVITAVASSPSPRPLPTDTGPGPTTQLGVARTWDDPANPLVLERVNTGR